MVLVNQSPKPTAEAYEFMNICVFLIAKQRTHNSTNHDTPFIEKDYCGHSVCFVDERNTTTQETEVLRCATCRIHYWIFAFQNLNLVGFLTQAFRQPFF